MGPDALAAVLLAAAQVSYTPAPLMPAPVLPPPRDVHAAPLPVAQLKATELRRWRAAEAHQGVAVDARFFYAVVNTRTGKYERTTGARVAEWVGDRRRILHLNSCSVDGAELVCANSDYPGMPMMSSVEFFDKETLRHLRSVPLGWRGGSLTWVERHSGFWWAGEGTTLEHVATIAAPLNGQAWAWDRSAPRTIFGLAGGGEVVSMTFPPVPPVPLAP